MKLRRLTMSIMVVATMACSPAGVGVGGGGGGVGFGAAFGPSMDKHERGVEKWYKERIERLTSDTGWLTLVGLFPLDKDTLTFGGAENDDLVFPGNAPLHAGQFIVTADKVHLDAAEGVKMTHGRKEVTSIDLASDKDGAEPTEIRMGTYDFYVIDRPGTRYLRVKDSDSEVRRSFDGIERYPVSKKWKVAAHLERYHLPHRVTIVNSMGFEEVVDMPGMLTFAVDGKEYQLEPLTEDKEEMWIVFGDATSGRETYGGGRFVYIPAPDRDGNTSIDFNRAYNPPCAFTPFATCPRPHAQNILPIKVEAGEKSWGHEAR